jgi:excisionase family DNA binding protein
VREAAALLKINEQTAYKLAGRGQLPGFRVGGSWRFDRGEIERGYGGSQQSVEKSMMVRPKTKNDARAAIPVEIGKHPQARSTGNLVKGPASMSADHFQSLEKFESGLWKIADNLRANSNLASNEYFMPIMGLIFLRHATNCRFR